VLVSDRAHLSIGEVLNLLQEEFPDVTISKIRFLESQGLLDPERTPSGYRKFYDADIERLRWILRQQRENFLPLKVIKDRLAAGELDEPEQLDLSDAAVPTERLAEVAANARSASARRSATRVTPTPPPAPVVDPGAVPDRSTDASTAGTVTLADGSGAGRRTSDGPAPDGRGSGSRPRRSPEAERPAAASSPAPSSPSSTSTPAPSTPTTPAPAPSTPSVLDAGATSMSLTLDELEAATGLTAREVGELERYGLLSSRAMGAVTYYDDDAVVVARVAASFLRQGVEPRHLRMYKIAAEREADLFEQLVLPALKQRSPGARQEAVARVADLADLGTQLRGAMVRQALRDYLSG
jgi:DNA-binding transcriptional MerR regulator